MRETTRRLYSFVLSFAVYLLPLLGPHTNFLLGYGLFEDITRSEREFMWIAGDIGFAVLLQLFAFLALYWLFQKPGALRLLLVFAAVPFLAVAAEAVYLIYIPSRFLIEKDTAVEEGKWAVECTAPDVGLVDVSHPEGSADWSELPVQASDGSYKLLRIPGCELIPLAIPRASAQPGGRVEFMTSLTYFVPRRGVIFNKQETATGAFTWNHLFNDQITAIPGLHSSAAPILSTDGEWAAWLEKGSIAVERIDGNEAPLQLTLPNLNASSYILRTVDMQKGEVELVDRDQRVLIGLD